MSNPNRRSKGESDYEGCSSANDFALARYQTDGALDMTFGTGGKLLLDISNSSTDAALSLAVQSDGKILVTGRANTGLGGLVRLQAA